MGWNKMGILPEQRSALVVECSKNTVEVRDGALTYEKLDEVDRGQISADV